MEEKKTTVREIWAGTSENCPKYQQSSGIFQLSEFQRKERNQPVFEVKG